MTQTSDLPAAYVTTPIYYLNAHPHLGHAYTSIAADFLARFWRLQGRPTYFLTGTDEHGLKIAQAAEARGLSPQAHTDDMAAAFQQMTREIGAEPNDFIRTTEPRHIQAAQSFWCALTDAGYIYKGIYSGWYAVRDEAYYTADEVIDGLAPTGAPVIWMEEDCYFFRLSAFQEPLLKWYNDHPDCIAPTSRLNEVKKWVQGGLSDLAVSRSTFTWGVPVPGDEGHVMYVWVEALANYLTALGYPDLTAPLFQKFWSSQGHIVHLVGKDILRFHAVYWPAFLMAAQLPLPHRVFAHGWWTVEGQKMSKSLGNSVAPAALISQYGLDPFRYFLLREISFGQDGDFSEIALKRRLNADLANDWGNLCQRTLAFVQKMDQCVPACHHDLVIPEAAPLQAWQHTLLEHLENTIEAQEIHRYLESVWEGIGAGNRFMDAFKPWTLLKTPTPPNIQRLEQGLYLLLDHIRLIALVLIPGMPQSAHALLDQLAVPQEWRTLPTARPLTPGTPLPFPQPLFTKME